LHIESLLFYLIVFACMTESRTVLPAFYMGLISDNDYLATKTGD